MNKLAIAFIFALVCHMALGDQVAKICNKGSYWNGQACAACPADCTECVLKNNAVSCIQCGTSKFLKLENDLGTCVSCLTNCDECRGPSVTDCFKPQAGFSVNPAGLFKCDKPGCQYCKADGTCEKCQFAYRLDNGACVKCSDNNCALCPAASSTCTKCTAGSMLNNTACVVCSLGCTNCPCTACKPGFQFSNNACTKCTDSNCVACDAKVDQCTACQSGFWANNGACTVCAENCLTCASDKQCTFCKSGYSAINGVCTKCPANCLVCNGNDECTKCFSTFFKSTDSKTCTSCLPNCAECTDATSCTKCDSNSLPVGAGVCKLFNSCQRGQQFDDKGVCSDVPIDNCVYGVASNGTCHQCADGYYPSAKICAPCPSGCEKCDVNDKGYVMCSLIAQVGFSIVTTNEKSDKTGYLGVDNVYTVKPNNAAEQCMPNSFLGIPSKEPSHTVCISDMEKCTAPSFTGISWQCNLGAMNLVAITVSLFTVVFAFLFTL